MNETFAEIRRLMLATNRIDGAYYLLSRKLGVKENILTLLYALDDEETHSQKRICEDWLFPKTTINTIIRELVQAGYVTLCREENGREKRIALTQAGKDYASKMLKGVYQAEQAAMEKTLQRFSPQLWMPWTTLPIASAVSWIIGCQNRKNRKEFPTWERAG